MAKISIAFVNPNGFSSIPVVRASSRYGNWDLPSLCLDNNTEKFFLVPYYLWQDVLKVHSDFVFVRSLPSCFSSFMNEIGLDFDYFVTDHEWQEILKFAANVDANKQKNQ